MKNRGSSRTQVLFTEVQPHSLKAFPTSTQGGAEAHLFPMGSAGLKTLCSTKHREDLTRDAGGCSGLQKQKPTVAHSFESSRARPLLHPATILVRRLFFYPLPKPSLFLLKLQHPRPRGSLSSSHEMASLPKHRTSATSTSCHLPGAAPERLKAVPHIAPFSAALSMVTAPSHLTGISGFPHGSYLGPVKATTCW